MSSTKSERPPPRDETELTEAEIAARFESTVRRMANTKPAPKLEKKSKDKSKPISAERNLE